MVASKRTRVAKPIVFILPLAAPFLRHSKPLYLLTWIGMAQSIYSIYVGGDAWEDWGGSNRYITPAMPLFFVLLTLTIESVYFMLLHFLKSPVFHKMVIPVTALLFIFCFINFNTLKRGSGLPVLILMEPAIHVRDNAFVLQLALSLNEITDKDARIAVTWAGIVPYFTDRPSIDLLGKCDRYVAHLPMRSDLKVSKWVIFYPGHMKWNYAYSIRNLKPDVVAQVIFDYPTAKEAMKGLYTTEIQRWPVNYKLGSSHVLWDKMNQSTGDYEIDAIGFYKTGKNR